MYQFRLLGTRIALLSANLYDDTSFTFFVFAIRRSLEENWHWVMTIITAIWVLPETMRTLFSVLLVFPLPAA